MSGLTLFSINCHRLLYIWERRNCPTIIPGLSRSDFSIKNKIVPRASKTDNHSSLPQNVAYDVFGLSIQSFQTKQATSYWTYLLCAKYCSKFFV